MTKGQASMTVSRADTAAVLGSGDLPVLGTPRVLALMEKAACDALVESLEPAQTSVGVAVELQHLAPTAVGATVDAEATITSRDDRRVSFAIRATVDGVEVARCTHSRVVVDRGRFLARLTDSGRH